MILPKFASITAITAQWTRRSRSTLELVAGLFSWKPTRRQYPLYCAGLGAVVGVVWGVLSESIVAGLVYGLAWFGISLFVGVVVRRSLRMAPPWREPEDL